MVARAVEEASTRLRELRRVEWEDLGLAAAALALSLAATRVYPPLAIPLFLGGLTVGALGVRAMWLRWDLVDRLSGEPDAYAIAEVRARGSREATMERRRSYAALIRTTLEARRVAAADAAGADELAALAAELEDDRLALDPVAAVACRSLVTDLEPTRLPSASLPPDELRARVVRIRRGFASGDRLPDTLAP
jgi:hypothetical protein